MATTTRPQTKTMRYLLDEAIRTSNNLAVYLAEHRDVGTTEVRTRLTEADYALNDVRDSLPS